MTDRPAGGWTRVTQFVPATPEDVFQAFLDPGALVEWLPPGEMTGVIHEFNPRVGGVYRMSLFYPSSEQDIRGKTAPHEDMVEVRFVELTPPSRIVEAVRFVSAAPGFAGEMTLTVSFAKAPGGTEVTLAFDDLPPGLRPEDNEAGSRLSLDQLARHFAGQRR